MLFMKEPKYLMVDEIDKMSASDQASLLGLMETGEMVETKVNKTRSIKLKTWVFATANTTTRLSKPLLTRFMVFTLKPYTYEDFADQGDVVLVRQRRPSARTESAPAATAPAITREIGGVVQLHGDRDAGRVREAAERRDQAEPVGGSRGAGRDQQDGAAACFFRRRHHGERGGEVVAGEGRNGRALLEGGGDKMIETGTHQALRPPTRIQATKVRAKPARPRMVVRTVQVLRPSETVSP